MRISQALRLRLFVLLALVLLAAPTLAKEPAHYLAPDALDLTLVLAPPPAAGSAGEKADLDELFALQNARTPEQAAFALADRDRSVTRFADVLGPRLTEANLAGAAAFFAKLHATENHFVGQAKRVWNRPRPFAVRQELAPSLPRPQSASYPSGHSSFGHILAIVLADMIPEKAAELHARGDLYARQRLVGGVHYPSDVEAGKIAAAVIAGALFRDQEFLADYAKAKAQVRAALDLPGDGSGK